MTHPARAGLLNRYALKSAPMIFTLRISVALFAFALFTGCSSFQREWERAATAVPAPGIAGRWAGSWESDGNHHGGELRCLITALANDQYSARFHARYKRVFNLTFGYTVVLNAQPGTNGIDFQGSANLGWYAGGTYQYNGHATATNFHSTYSCKYDHGTFLMTRPASSEDRPR